MMGGYYGNGYGGMGGGGLFGGLIFLVFAALVIAGVVLLVIWAVRASSGGHGHMGAGTTPQPPTTPPQAATTADEACAIARKRYASGEITKEQFEEICKTLGV